MDSTQQMGTYQYAMPYTGGPMPQPYPPTMPPQQQMTPPQPQPMQPTPPYQQQPFPQAPQQTYPLPYQQLPTTRTEESYIENIIRMNRGKVGTFYFTYSDSNEWRDRVYKGVIEAAGVDHIIISDPRDGKRYILLNIYLDWVEFNEEINYEYPLR